MVQYMSTNYLDVIDQSTQREVVKSLNHILGSC